MSLAILEHHIIADIFESQKKGTSFEVP